MAIQGRTITPAPKAALRLPAEIPETKSVVKSVGKPANGVGTSAVQTSARESIIKVSVTRLENGQIKGVPVEHSALEIKSFATNPAHVGVNLNYTRNLGNYESLKMGVMINMPCYVEEMDSAFAQVLDKAKVKLEEILAEFPQEAAATEEVVERDGTSTGVTSAEVVAAAEEIAGEATEEAGEVTQDALDAASHEELIEYANGTKDTLGVDPDDFPEEDDLRAALSHELFGDQSAGVVGAEEAVDPEPSTDVEPTYTAAELMDAAVTVDDLKEVFTRWELGAYPKGPASTARKAAVARILKHQETRGT